MREGLYAIVGAAGVSADTDSYRIGDALPAAVVSPENEAEVCALLEYAQGMRAPCIVAGSGTHLTHLTPHEHAWWLLSTRRLNRVIDYSPQDLVLTVGAGMMQQAVQELLRAHRQYLPWNLALPEQATIGGIVASNRAGSWRYRYGTPRDRLLAVRAVRTDGVAFKSGAKVVKSVAGYDLHRLLSGSWGTLAAITEVTLKVQPLPPLFEAAGWFTSWRHLEPTLAELMRLPIQPDGVTVVALREREAQRRSGLRAVAHTELQWGATPSNRARLDWSGQGAGGVRLGHKRRQPSATLTETPRLGRVELPTPPALPEPETLLQPLTAPETPQPFVLLEFSGSPDGVAWQIQHLRERGYPAEPVDEAQLRQLRDWLAPRQHALMLQILLHSSEVAEAMAQWTALPGVSTIAHAGNGVLYVAADENGLTETLIQRVRALNAKYRVLNGAMWLCEQTGGELPRLTLGAGERRLMQRLKHALDAKNLLPTLV